MFPSENSAILTGEPPSAPLGAALPMALCRSALVAVSRSARSAPACMYVCVCACVCACVCVCITRLQACMCLCVCVCMYVFLCMCLYACVYKEGVLAGGRALVTLGRTKKHRLRKASLWKMKHVF